MLNSVTLKIPGPEEEELVWASLGCISTLLRVRTLHETPRSETTVTSAGQALGPNARWVGLWRCNGSRHAQIVSIANKAVPVILRGSVPFSHG